MSTVEKHKPVKEYRECRLVGEGVAVYKGWWEKATLIKWPLSRDLKEVREEAMQTAGEKISGQRE